MNMNTHPIPGRPTRGRSLAIAVLGIGLAIGVLAGPVQAQPATRIVTDDLGNVVTIPVDPQRIVAIRGDHITAPLLELGAHVVASTGVVSQYVNGGQPYVRGAYDILDFRFENSDVTFVGLDNEFDIEAIAAARPDLIFAPFNTTRLDQLTAIAPTVLIRIINTTGEPANMPIERYRRIADFAGMCGAATCLDRFDAMAARFAERLTLYKAVMAEQIPDPSAIVVAALDLDNSVTPVAWRHFGWLMWMVDEMGFSHPPLIGNLVGTDRLLLSPEQLPELQADFLISTTRYGFPGGMPADVRAVLDGVLLGWDAFLHAPGHNQWIFLDRERMQSTTFASARYTLDFLMTNIVMRGFVPVAPPT